MENRWGFKDFVILSLLVLIIVIVLLAMKQFDRQYQVVQELRDNSREQFKTLVDIDRKLEQGVAINTRSAPTTQASGIGDPFGEVKKLKQQGKYVEGDWLVDNFGAAVAKITPLLSSDVYGAMLQCRVMESLAYRDPNTLEYLPLLAESWSPTVDNTAAWQAYIQQRLKVPLTEAEVLNEPDCPPADKAKDRADYVTARMKEGRRADDVKKESDCPPALSMTFKLRKGVKFSDGSPMTADDVVFTFDWTMNPKVDAPRDRAYLDKIKSVTKLDDYTVEFKFNDAYFQAFDLASGIQVMSKAFYGKYSPEDFNNSVGLLIGTGPYKLANPTDWKPNAAGTIELIRNDRYWGEPSSFDKLVYYQVESDLAEQTMFINGQLDMFAAQPEQYVKLLANKDLLARAQHFEYLSPVAGYNFIAWNELRDGKPTIFADKRVRQALTMLIDRKAICDQVMLGYAVPAAGPFNPNSEQNDPSLKDWQYDPTKAFALLKDAGFEVRDRDGILKKADGTPLGFKLCYPSKNETIERIMLMIKDGLVRNGVNAQIDPADWPIVQKRLDSRDYDAISLGWSAGIEDDIYQMFDSSQSGSQGDNFMSYSNPEFDQAVRTARSTIDKATRIKLWQKADRILHEDQPYTFLTVRKSLVFVDNRIQNVALSKMGLNFRSLDVMPIVWSVPTSLQKYKN